MNLRHTNKWCHFGGHRVEKLVDAVRIGLVNPPGDAHDLDVVSWVTVITSGL